MNYYPSINMSKNATRSPGADALLDKMADNDHKKLDNIEVKV